MKSALPKVLQPLAGRPLLAHVIEAARKLSPDAIHVVYGHGGASVRAALSHEQVGWVEQAQQRGTGHAVLQALPGIADEQTVLVLYGDVPLIRAQTLAELVALAGPKSLALLTVRLEDPAGYGRVVRARGRVQRIVEEKDATRRELAVRECNTGRARLAGPPAQALAGARAAAQRPGRVLPDGHHRDGREGQDRGRAAGGRAGERGAGRQRPRAAGGAGGRAARAARAGAAAGRRDARRPGARRRARHLAPWAGRVDRRERRVRRRSVPG